MVYYRRARNAGATYFFTVTVRDRRSGLLTEQVEALRRAFREVRGRSPFVIDAIVVLPDHLHTVWTLPEGDSDFSGRWKAFKGRFTHFMIKQGKPLQKDQRGEYNL